MAINISPTESEVSREKNYLILNIRNESKDRQHLPNTKGAVLSYT